MENRDPHVKASVLEEEYQGPSRKVTAAGEGAIAHYGIGAGMLIVGGIVGMNFSKSINNSMDRWKTAAVGWRDSSKSGAKALGNFSNWLVGAPKGSVTATFDKIKDKLNGTEAEHIKSMLEAKEGGLVHWAAEHVLKIPGLRGLLQKGGTQKVEAAIAAGGLSGLAGFFLSPIYFAFTGVKHANDGRHQFERAQDQLRTAHGERDALRERYTETKLELEDVKTSRDAKEGALQVAKDNPIVRTRDHRSEVQGASPTHVEKPTIEGPPIQSPTIGSPTVSSPIPKNQWWDGKEGAQAAVSGHAEKLAARDAEALLSEAAR